MNAQTDEKTTQKIKISENDWDLLDELYKIESEPSVFCTQVKLARSLKWKRSEVEASLKQLSKVGFAQVNHDGQCTLTTLGRQIYLYPTQTRLDGIDYHLLVVVNPIKQGSLAVFVDQLVKKAALLTALAALVAIGYAGAKVEIKSEIGQKDAKIALLEENMVICEFTKLAVGYYTDRNCRTSAQGYGPMNRRCLPNKTPSSELVNYLLTVHRKCLDLMSEGGICKVSLKLFPQPAIEFADPKTAWPLPSEVVEELTCIENGSRPQP